MSTNERDELDSLIKADVAGVWCVSYDNARRIVDDLKAKLAEVTRERDATREGYRELGEKYDVAKRQIEWLNKQLHGSDGYIETAKNLRIELSDRAKERDQAREQLATVQAEAAAMRRAFGKRIALGVDYYESPKVEVKFVSGHDAGECYNAIGDFIQGHDHAATCSKRCGS